MIELYVNSGDLLDRIEFKTNKGRSFGAGGTGGTRNGMVMNKGGVT